MANEKKIFVGGMDRDSDLRFVKNGDYRDALNINVFSTEEDGEVGVISNMKGAEEIKRYLGINYYGNQHKVIGAVEDPSFDRVIFFVAFTGLDVPEFSLSDSIVEYSLKTNECYTILQSDELNFNPQYRINDAFIVGHKEDYSPEGFLYFNDNYNPPRKINIAEEKLNAPASLAEIVPSSGGRKKYKNIVTGFEYEGVSPTLQGLLGHGITLQERINVARIAPLIKPTVTISTDSSFKANYVKGKAFKFKYRYQYKDKQYSAWSPISEMIATEEGTPQTNGTSADLSQQNLIKVGIKISNSDIESVELAVRDLTNSDTYGLVDTLSYYNQDGFYYEGNKITDKFLVGGYADTTLNQESATIVSSNSIVEYYFYNNEIYPAIDLRESTKLFNNIPIKAKTQSLIDGGRIAYGNVVTGRTGHNPKLNVRNYDAGDIETNTVKGPVTASASCAYRYKKWKPGSQQSFCSRRAVWTCNYTVNVKFNDLPDDMTFGQYNVIINNLPFTAMWGEDVDDTVNSALGFFNLFENSGNPPGTPSSNNAATVAQTFYNSVISNLTGGQISSGAKITSANFTGSDMVKLVDADNAYLRAGHVDAVDIADNANSGSGNSNCTFGTSDSYIEDNASSFSEHNFISISGDTITFRWSVLFNFYNYNRWKRPNWPVRDHGCFVGINNLSEFNNDTGNSHNRINVIAEQVVSNINSDVSYSDTGGWYPDVSSSEFDWRDYIEQQGGDLQAQDTILNIYKSVVTSNATLEVQYTQLGYKPVETGFKTGSWHNFGVVYYDKQGRSSSVQGKTSVYIPTHLEKDDDADGEVTTTLDRYGVEYYINNLQAPYWADKYQIVYTGNRNIRKFEQFVTDGFHTSTIFPDVVFVNANPLFNALETSGGKGVDAQFEPGDRLRILTSTTAALNGKLNDGPFDFQIVDVVKVTKHTPTEGNELVANIQQANDYTAVEIKGHHLNVTRTLHTDTALPVPERDETDLYFVLNKSDFDQTSVYTSGNSLALGGNAKVLADSLVEVYSLKKEVDEDELIFFEFDEIHDTVKTTSSLMYANFTEGSSTVQIDSDNLAEYPQIVEGVVVQNALAFPYGAVVEQVIRNSSNQVTSFITSAPASLTVDSVGTLETKFISNTHGVGYNSDGSEYFKLTRQGTSEPNGDVYTRIRRYRTDGGIVSAGVESYHFSDFFKSDFWNSGRANKELESYHESRKPNTIIYTDSIIGNTYINGLNSSFENEYFTEFDKSNGTIQKIFARNNYIVIFQEDKVLKAFVERNMTFDASGSGNLALSSEIISKSVPYEWEGGIGEHPESFASYGDTMYFFDSQRGEVLKIQNDRIELISDKGMSSFFSNKAKELALMGNKAQIIGAYDTSKNEYVLSFEGAFEEEVVELCEVASGGEYWNSQDTYNPGDVVNYALSSDEQEESGDLAEIIYIAVSQNTNIVPYSNSSVVTIVFVSNSNALWSPGDTINIPAPAGATATTSGVITVNSVTKPVASVSINAAGSGYEVDDILAVDGDQNYDNPLLIKVSSIGADGAVTGLTIQDGGDFTGFNIPTTGLIAVSEDGDGEVDDFTGFGLSVDITYSAVGQIVDYSLTSQGDYTASANAYTPSVEDGDKTASLQVTTASAWTVCSGLGAQIGCTDDIANNYSSEAIYDDGSCNYDCLGVVFDDGCGTITATSTPSTVNLEELVSFNLVDQAVGSIDYAITNTCEGSGTEYHTVIVRNGQVVLIDLYHNNEVIYENLLAGFYNFITVDTNSIEANLGSFTLPEGFTDPFDIDLPESTIEANAVILYNILQDCGVQTEVAVQLLACDNPAAVNYASGYGEGIVINPTTIGEPDPCTLDIFGCTNSSSPNYDSDATADDGSCIVCSEDDGTNNLFGVFAPDAVGIQTTTFDIEVSLTDEAEYEGWIPQYIVTVFKDNQDGEIFFQQEYTDIDGYLEVGTGGTVSIEGLDLTTGGLNPQLQTYMVRVEAVDSCTVDQFVTPGWIGCTTPESVNYNALATEDPGNICVNCTNVLNEFEVISFNGTGQPTELGVAGDSNNPNNLQLVFSPGLFEDNNPGVTMSYEFSLVNEDTGAPILDSNSNPIVQTVVGSSSAEYTVNFENVFFDGLGDNNYRADIKITSSYSDNSLECFTDASTTVGLYGCTTNVYSGGELDGLSTENYNELATVDNGTCFTCGQYSIINVSTVADTNGLGSGSISLTVQNLLSGVYAIEVLNPEGLVINPTLTGIDGSGYVIYTYEGLTTGDYNASLILDAPYDICDISETISVSNDIPGCLTETSQNHLVSDYGTPNVQATSFPDACQFCPPKCSWSQETLNPGGFDVVNNFDGRPENIQGFLFNTIVSDASSPGAVDGSIKFQLIRGSFTNPSNPGGPNQGADSWVDASSEIQSFINLMELGGQVRFNLYSDPGYTEIIQTALVGQAEFIALESNYALQTDTPIVVAEFTGLDGNDSSGNPTEYYYQIEYLQVPQAEASSNSSFFANPDAFATNSPYLLTNSACSEADFNINNDSYFRIQYKYLEGCSYKYEATITDEGCPSIQGLFGAFPSSVWSDTNISANSFSVDNVLNITHASMVSGDATLDDSVGGALSVTGSSSNPGFWADSVNNGGNIEYVRYQLRVQENTSASGYDDGDLNGVVGQVTVQYSADGTPVASILSNPNNGVNPTAYGGGVESNLTEAGSTGYNFSFTNLRPAIYKLKVTIHFSTSDIECVKVINDIEVKLYGCKFNGATNYNSEVEYPTEQQLVLGDCGAICCMPDITDCADPSATNVIDVFTDAYTNNVTFQYDDNNIITSAFSYGIYSNAYQFYWDIINDADSCYIAGCMNPDANNYNANATVPCDEEGTWDVNNSDDNTCCAGCIDPTALNYNSNFGSDCSGVEGGNNHGCCNYLIGVSGNVLNVNDAQFYNQHNELLGLEYTRECDIIYGGLQFVNEQITVTGVASIENGDGEVLYSNIFSNGVSQFTALNNDPNNSMGSNIINEPIEVGLTFNASTFTPGTSNGAYYYQIAGILNPILVDSGNTFAGGGSGSPLFPYVLSNSPFANPIVQPLNAVEITTSNADIINQGGQDCQTEYPVDTFGGNKWFLKMASASSSRTAADVVDDESFNDRLFESFGLNNDGSGADHRQFIDLECLDLFHGTSCEPVPLGYEVVNNEASSDNSNIGVHINEGNVKVSLVGKGTSSIHIRIFQVDENGDELIFNQDDSFTYLTVGDSSYETAFPGDFEPFSWDIKYTCIEVDSSSGTYTATLDVLQNNDEGKRFNINHSLENIVNLETWCQPRMQGFNNGLGYIESNNAWNIPSIGTPQTAWKGLWFSNQTSNLNANALTIEDI